MTAEVHDLFSAAGERRGPPGERPAECLEAAGWRPKERCGKTIWAHPESGFYYSEEMALQMVRRERESEEE